MCQTDVPAPCGLRPQGGGVAVEEGLLRSHPGHQDQQEGKVFLVCNGHMCVCFFLLLWNWNDGEPPFVLGRCSRPTNDDHICNLVTIKTLKNIYIIHTHTLHTST